MATHRTTVELDLQAVKRAQKHLGTTTIRETIDRALREIDRYAALRRAAAVIRAGDANVVRREDLPKLRRVRR